MEMQLDLSQISKDVSLEILVKKTPVKISKVYDYYWIFAKKRQDAFFARMSGKPFPWSDDPILQKFKFTNAYRASDRVSQYLIKEVIYKGDQSVEDVFFRCILFKIFNKIETWKLLLNALGDITYREYSFDRYDSVLTAAMSRGESIYSAAYIMPSRGIPTSHKKKHRMHLELVSKMLADELPKKVSNATSLKDVYELLLAYPGIGKFLAFQYAIDLNYSNITNFDEMDYVVAGPGANNGIIKCFSNTAGLSNEDIIKHMTESQEEQFLRLGLDFKDLWGRPLQLIDCQNLFCEIDKYSRVKFPEMSAQTGRTRIKQKYKVNPMPVDYWFPPKWGINQ
jgi:hypothetical protein